MKDDSKKATDFLEGKNASMQTILFKVQLLKKLNAQFVKYIDANITEYCQVANRVGSKLIIVAANGSIATQLRFESADLLRKFRADAVLGNITQIEIKVRPTTTYSTPKIKARKVAPLSKDTAQLIDDIAESIDDPRLKQAMKRIARYTKD